MACRSAPGASCLLLADVKNLQREKQDWSLPDTLLPTRTAPSPEPCPSLQAAQWQALEKKMRNQDAAGPRNSRLLEDVLGAPRPKSTNQV